MTYQEFLVIVIFAGSIVPLISIINLVKNYRTARKIGDLPILITPVSLLSPVWALIWAVAGGLLQPILLNLPFGLGDWARYSGHTWFYAHGHDLHQKYGPVFIVVTPSEIEMIIADPDTAHEVTSRRKEFIKEGRMYKPLEIFGPNVDTLNGEAWQRHRRFVATPLNDRNNRIVWQESLNQANDMLSVWLSTSKSQNGVRGTSSDTMTLSLHVLQSAGFGKVYSFESGVSKPEDGHTMSYKDSLRLILGNVFLTVVIKSAAVLPSFIQPQKIKKLKTAVVEFRKYMFEMIEEEKAALQDTKVEQKFNLLSLIVKLSEQEGESTGKKGLTDDELFGNLFMYNLAGHDTIANTMAYAIVLMASDLHWQKWIREELDIVFKGKDNIKDWEYEKAFPRLKRCAALMNETLRLYGPVPAVSRCNEKEAIITISGKKYFIPPKTWFPINHAALQTLPSYWGEDSLVWRPDRWILNPSPESPSIATANEETPSRKLERETLYHPIPGLFIPWTSGPRICPGKKFSQVEFAAVIARLFHKHNVFPVREDGETSEQAKKRCLEVARESLVTMTLQMADPERLVLFWQPVEND